MAALATFHKLPSLRQAVGGPLSARSAPARPAGSPGGVRQSHWCTSAAQAGARQHGRRPAVAASAAAASSGDAAAAAASAPAAASGGRHALLHDFCMCLPYGAIVAAGGLAARLLFGWGQPANVMMVVGAMQLGLSYLSLNVWRQKRSSAPFTMLEAGLASWLAYYSYRAVQQGVAPLAMGVLLALSAAMSAFLLYNVAAGGNPPRRGTHDAAAAPAS